eukprot:COSAG05_NODE_149_length_16213_cov_66.750279_7_plen_121_part_00
MVGKRRNCLIRRRMFQCVVQSGARERCRRGCPFAIPGALPPVCFTGVFAVELLGADLAVIFLEMLSRVSPGTTILAPGQSSRRTEQDRCRVRSRMRFSASYCSTIASSIYFSTVIKPVPS